MVTAVAAAAKSTVKLSAKLTAQPTAKLKKTARTVTSKEKPRKATANTKKTKKSFAANKPGMMNVAKFRNRRSKRRGDERWLRLRL